MLTSLAIAAGVAFAAGCAAGWKLTSALKAAAIGAKDVEITKLLAERDAALADAQSAHDQLARERVTMSAEEERRDVVEKRLRADVEALQRMLREAAARDPVLAGDWLDAVLGKKP